MKLTKHLFLTLLISGTCAAGAHGQGLIGQTTFDFNAGYERVSGFNVGGGLVVDDVIIPSELPPPAAARNRTLDGVGAGAAFNLPLTRGRQEIGIDARGELDYFRVTGSGTTFHSTSISGGLRAYAPVQQVFKPFAGAGIGWNRVKVDESDDTIFFPLEVGVEWVSGPFSVTPYYRYVINTDGDFDNFWEVGGTGAYWFNRGMAVSVSVSHTDYKGDAKKLGVRAGLIFSF